MDNSRMPMYCLYSIPMQIYLVVFGIIYLVIVKKIRNLEGKTRKDFVNELINSCMWFVAAIFYPFSYSDEIPQQIEIYFNMFTDFAMIGIFVVIAIILIRQKILLRMKPSLKKERTFEVFLERFDRNYTFKKDLKRKGFHAFIPAFVISLYIITIILNKFFSVNFVNIHDLGVFFIINCGFGGLFLFAAADIVRLSYFFKDQNLSIFHLLPSSVLDILTKRMHYSELYTFVPTVLILISFVPFLSAPFSVFASVTLIASVSDAIASIMGKLFNQKFPDKLIFPPRSYRFFKNKNIVGYISGFFTTIVIVMALLLLYPLPTLNFIKVMIIALVVSITFLTIDILSLDVNDNFLNSVICGLVMLLTIWFL
ncbi:MAG: hypothetical protein ACTSRA_15605 [Promethearchaeota archaeon]